MSVMDEFNEVDKLIGVTNYQLLEETRLGFGGNYALVSVTTSLRLVRPVLDYVAVGELVGD
jgi:hypothetical protein